VSPTSTERRALINLSYDTVPTPQSRTAVRGSLRGMTISSNPYRGFRFPREVIEHAVWLYHCFSLSPRDVELILAARGIVVSYESIREWGLRFGRIFANMLRQRRPQPGDKW
jgi:putative transposase